MQFRLSPQAVDALFAWVSIRIEQTALLLTPLVYDSSVLMIPACHQF